MRAHAMNLLMLVLFMCLVKTEQKILFKKNGQFDLIVNTVIILYF